ncbi:MAG: septum formation initiator family protein [Ferruginibacter sp.]|nr:septum formation initiator family protein [Cytophagales bacterium]
MKNILLKLSRNSYLLIGISFLVWMLVFDPDDFITQYRMSRKLRDLEAEKTYYLEKIEEVKKDRQELLGNPRLREKFAREKYLMKKNTEEVFVTVDEKNNPLE